MVGVHLLRGMHRASTVPEALRLCVAERVRDPTVLEPLQYYAAMGLRAVVDWLMLHAPCNGER